MTIHRGVSTGSSGRSATIRRTARLRAALIGSALVATLVIGGGLGLQLAAAASPSSIIATVTGGGGKTKHTGVHKALVGPSRGGRPQATTKGS